MKVKKMVLQKETVLFERDEEGKLLPKEVELVINENDFEQVKLKGETIVCIPMARGEIKRMYSEIARVSNLIEQAETDEEKDKIENDPKNDYDRKIIIEHCVSPKFTSEDYEYAKGGVISAIVNTVLFQSGIDTRSNRNVKNAIDKKEDEFAKN